jgi:protein Mpv17
MVFLPFATRLTTRRLHQTVQRNILRQHQARYESNGSQTSNTSSTSSQTTTSTPPPPRGPTIPGPTWAWITPPIRGYNAMQKRSPLLTQLEASLIIYYLGDLSAQTLQTSNFSEGTYEPIRGLRALIIAGIVSIPSYKWFLFLGNHFNYSSHVVSIGVKIVVNQMVFTPLFNTYFFSMQSLLAGASLGEAWERVRSTVPVSWRNSWKVWPAVTAFSFTFIKPQNRSVFAGLVAIFWQGYLSWLNKRAENC